MAIAAAIAAPPAAASQSQARQSAAGRNRPPDQRSSLTGLTGPTVRRAAVVRHPIRFHPDRGFPRAAEPASPSGGPAGRVSAHWAPSSAVPPLSACRPATPRRSTTPPCEAGRGTRQGRPTAVFRPPEKQGDRPGAGRHRGGNEAVTSCATTKPDGGKGDRRLSRNGLTRRERAREAGRGTRWMACSSLALFSPLLPPLPPLWLTEKGTGTFCRNGPPGAAHKRCQSPFPPAHAAIVPGRRPPQRPIGSDVRASWPASFGR